MCRILLGAICGLIFGALDVAMMIPMSFPDKRLAMPAAFISRFAIGFGIVNIRLPVPGWAVGLLVGVLMSLPDAIITKTFAPFLGTGAIGGLIIGWVASRFGH